MKRKVNLWERSWLRLPALCGAMLAWSGTSMAQEEAEAQPEVAEAYNVVVEAIAAEDAEEFEPPSVWVGILLKNVEGDLAKYLGSEKGILVENVYEGSPADKAKLMVGDVLTFANDTELSNPMNLLTVLKSIEIGDEVKLKLLRKGKELEVGLVPTERPADLAEKLGKDLENIEEDLKLELHAEGMDEKALADVLKKVYAGDGKQRVQIFRMGDGPSYMFKSDDLEQQAEDLEVTVLKNVDGNEIKVNVVRKDDKPAEITVVRGEDVTKFTQEDLDELPEEVAEIVKATLEENRFQFKVLPKRFEAIELGQREALEKAREMAAEQARQAQQQAERIRVQVQQRVGEGKEMAELRELVEQLRSEVKELRKRLGDDR